MQKDTILIGIILLIVLWTFIERKLLLTTKHTISSDKLPESLSNTGFVLLADLHNCTFGRNNRRLIKRIKELEPDFIIVAGDMVNKKEICYPSNAFTLIEQLAKSYPLYYAYGNHEQRLERIGEDTSIQWTKEDREYNSTWIEYKKNLEYAKVTFLNNESTILNLHSASLRITGVSLPHEYFKFSSSMNLPTEELNLLIGESSRKNFQLLIAHNPVHFKTYTSWGADLTLSGHLHGGMMRLPGIGGVISPQAKFFPKYDNGKHRDGQRHLIVSRGLGSHSIMPRLFNIPEIIYVKLKKNNAE
jgi:predicted MPP superfamily phosphohydrolase